MKIIFFIAGIFFFSIGYSQQKTFFNPDPNIQRYIKKKKEERLIQMAMKLMPEPNTNRIRIIVCYPGLSLVEYLAQEINKRTSYILPSSNGINTSLFMGDTCNKFEGCIVAPEYATNQWKIKPLTQQKLKELRDYIKGSKTDFRPYFN